MIDRPLRYRAGPAALELLRRRGLDPAQVRVLAGPASGPRWIALAGLDRALIELGLAGGGPAAAGRLLVGASAGAWRMLALAAPDAARRHGALLEGYIDRVLPRGAGPAAISAIYRELLGRLFDGRLAGHLERDGAPAVAVHVTRVRAGVPWRGRSGQTAALALAAALNALHPRALGLLFERVLVHSRGLPDGERFDGRLVRLDRTTLLDAALASGSVPVYMAPVRGLPGIPGALLVDGGVTDYHLRQRWTDGAGLTLFPHVGREIRPVWFDRFGGGRGPAPAVLDRVLLVHPSADFVAGLPGGRLPDRDDFFRFADDPAERIRRWRDAAVQGERLGQALLRDVESGRLAELVEPI